MVSRLQVSALLSLKKLVMKSFTPRLLSLLALVFLSSVVYAPTSWPQVRVGKNLEQIVRLAEKEGKVRIASALDRDEESLVFRGFVQKYPKIKIETSRITGSDSREKIFTEGLAGVVEYDLADISSEVQEKFIKAGLLAGPFQWRSFFPNIDQKQIHPNGYLVGVGWSAHMLAYNSSVVPPDRVPKKWEDCLDPYLKGKFVVDTRPKSLTSLAVAWGEERILDFAAKLKNNQPVWKRGQTEALTQLAAGEYAMICGSYYQSLHRLTRRDPKTKLAVSFPSEVPASVGEALAVLKGGNNPNTAILLTGWLASPEGQKAYDKIGRGSPFVEGSEKWTLMRKVGAKVVLRQWEDNAAEEDLSKKILAVWGLAGGSGRKAVQ
jgi:iron(III) transport system substrate-binding protein